MTDKQLAFIDEYMKDRNATQAVIRAGGSVKSAASIGSEYLTKPKIAEEIARRKAAIAGKAGITPEEIIEELKALAFADYTQIYREDGTTLKPINEWPANVRKCIAGIESISFGEGIGTVSKVKLHNKNSSIEMLMKYAGMFIKDNEQKKPVTNVNIGFNDEAEDGADIPAAAN